MKLVKRKTPDKSVYMYELSFEEFDRLHNPRSGVDPYVKYCELIILDNGNIVTLTGSHQTTILNLVAKYMDVVDDDGNVLDPFTVSHRIIEYDAIPYENSISNKNDLIWQAIDPFDSVEAIAAYHLNLISVWRNLLTVKSWSTVTKEQKETINKLYENEYIKYSTETMYRYGDVPYPSVDFLKKEDKALLVKAEDLYPHAKLPGTGVIFKPLEYACPGFKYKFAFELLIKSLIAKKKLVPHLLLFYIEYSLYNENGIDVFDTDIYITNREGSSSIKCGEKSIMKISTRFPIMIGNDATDTYIVNKMYRNAKFEYI